MPKMLEANVGEMIPFYARNESDRSSDPGASSHWVVVFSAGEFD